MDWIYFTSILVISQWTLIQGNLIDQQTCNKSGVISTQLEITTHYAPSLISCSFICRDHPDCRTYAYSGKQCKLYWSTVSSVGTMAGLTARTTCKNTKQVCPKSLNNGEYSCSFFAQQNTCFCISSVEVNRATADSSCTKYGMKLLSVETTAENTFVRNLFNGTKGWCVWTSGMGVSFRNYKWNSTGNAVDIYINFSDYIDHWFGGYCLFYSKVTPGEPWRWDDMECSVVSCINLCEFVPHN